MIFAKTAGNTWNDFRAGPEWLANGKTAGYGINTFLKEVGNAGNPQKNKCLWLGTEFLGRNHKSLKNQLLGVEAIMKKMEQMEQKNWP
ncbi:MAG: hypothetical protein M0Z61_01700 [Nitrospiraceae bacterium]|nr:hypothetical protein [Nitrospiraceae bacterium]